MTEQHSPTEETVAPKFLIQGIISTGKSYAIRTLNIKGRTTLVLQTEPCEILDDIPCSSNFHLARAFPAQITLETLKSNARRLHTMSMKQLQEMVDPQRHNYGQFLDVLSLMENFVCHRCKQSFGNLYEWPTTYNFVIDGLSGLSQMALDLVVGSKPIKTQPEWGAAMDNLERFITTICMNTNCVFVLLAHVEREQDEITGGYQNMVATLGRKLAPKLPKYFSDIAKAYRSVDAKGQPTYYWSTSDSMSVLKNRNLPFHDQIKPDFSLPISVWQQRLETARTKIGVAA